MQELLFVYGTLQDPKIRMMVLGREIPSLPDVLEGYRREAISCNGIGYPILVRDHELKEMIEGLLMAIEPDDLPALDRYEAPCYSRTRVRLKSGALAWVYVAPPDTI